MVALILPVLLCFVAVTAASVAYDACSEENCWGTGWLQEAVVLSSRFSAMDAADAEATARAALAGPLTEHITPDTFSTYSVPISSGVTFSLILVLLLVAVHEYRVAGGAKPLLADHQRGNSLLFQCANLYSWFIPFVVLSLLIPVSLDFAIDMGQSATASGLFLSVASVFAVLGVVVSKRIVPEDNWDQRWARKVFLACNAMATAVLVVNAYILLAAAQSSLNARAAVFWVSSFLFGTVNFMVGLCALSRSVMWNLITPQREKTFWMIMTQCSRNCGLLLGPVLFAIVSYLVKEGLEVSPVCMMGWSMIAAAIMILSGLVLASLAFPSQIPNRKAEEEPPEAMKKAEAEVSAEAQPEELTAEAREAIVWHMIRYSFERPMCVAAIEFATIMILEVSYAWRPEECGAALMVVAAVSMVLTATSTILLSRQWITPSIMFFGAALFGWLGVFLIFDWGARGTFGAITLLVADGIVYGSASVANGIAEGWASRATAPGTGYSNEIYRSRMLVGIYTSRFMAPIFARFLVDFGGRNVYAGLQLFLCSLGTISVYRTVTLVWRGKVT